MVLRLKNIEAKIQTEFENQRWTNEGSYFLDDPSWLFTLTFDQQAGSTLLPVHIQHHFSLWIETQNLSILIQTEFENQRWTKEGP